MYTKTFHGIIIQLLILYTQQVSVKITSTVTLTRNEMIHSHIAINDNDVYVYNTIHNIGRYQ